MWNFLETIRDDLAAMRPAHRRLLLGTVTAIALAAGAVFALAVRFSIDFPRAPFRQPSRLYARPTLLEVGATYDPADLVAELEEQGYREGPERGPLPRGTFRRGKGAVSIRLRRFPTPEGEAGGEPVEVLFEGKRVAQIETAGRRVAGLELEPALLASFYGPDVDERRPVRLDDLPEEVVRAVLAAEDDGFYTHPGVSPTGILRAAWTNLRGGELAQGGSTVTQQVVKNIYLSQERTLTRKAKEAVLAVLIELRYSKRQILETYLNEIYWGRSGPANVIGLGAAARAHFGKDAPQLTLAEAATLAGMIQAPADYAPATHPREARERRDWVLRRLLELGWADPRRVEAALRQPVRPAPEAVVARRRAPYFVEVARAEARERFDVEELADEGYLLFSTLGWREQKEAEEAVRAELARLETGPERRRKSDGPLQAALLSVDPNGGAIRAYVGGRDFAVSQFDRVAGARRQAGSTFKPVIYAAAFTEAVAHPATLLRDSPIVVRTSGRSWRPHNNDRSFRGMVTVRTALARSLNIPTVRLALQVGLPRVIALAREMGIGGGLEPVPALALGAFEVTPRELADVYSVFAGGGTRPVLHGLAAVVDPKGEALLSAGVPAPRRVLPPQSAYLVTSILQGVVPQGPGGRAALAGKTGTTNGRRDNWFVGYSPDRVTVVWVGYDDNAKTRLSGSSAAVPLWNRFLRAVRPARGFPPFEPPPGIVTASIDPATGQLATDLCPEAVAEVFPEWQVPTQPCSRHLYGYGEPWMDARVGDEPYLDPLTGQPVDPNLPYAPYTAEPGAPADPGAEGYKYEIDTSEWDDPQEAPPPAEDWRLRPLQAPPYAEEEDEEGDDDGTILIRPSRPEPAEPPPGEEGFEPGVEPGVEPGEEPGEEEVPEEEVEPPIYVPPEDLPDVEIEVEPPPPPPPPPAA